MGRKPWGKKRSKRPIILYGIIAVIILIAIGYTYLGAPGAPGTHTSCVEQKIALYQEADLIPETIVIRFGEGVTESKALEISSDYGTLIQLNTTEGTFNTVILVPDNQKYQTICDLEELPETWLVIPQKHLPQ